MAYLASDLGSSRLLHHPLGSIVGLEGKILKSNNPPSISDVIFQLELPVLEKIPTTTLIALRSQKREALMFLEMPYVRLRLSA